jgi:Zn-dependent protease
MLPGAPGQQNRASTLTFTVGTIPVNVHWSVLLVVAILAAQIDLRAAIGWTGGFLAAVVIHELGHALLAKKFGAGEVQISLMMFGGATTFIPFDMSQGKRFLVSAAGSALGIAVGGPLYWAERFGSLSIPPGDLQNVVRGFVLSAFFWGVFNWLPMLPLDGGQMLVHALALKIHPGIAHTVARAVSVVSAAGAVFAAQVYFPDSSFLTVFILIIAAQGIFAPNPYRYRGAREDDMVPPESEDPLFGVGGDMSDN